MNNLAPSVFNDFTGLTELKYQAREDQSGTAEKAARQFESLFIRMMVKQMRQAGFGGGMLDTQQTRFVQDMYDQQLAVHLSEQRGIGMLSMLRGQLSGEAKSEQQELSGLDDYWRNPAVLAKRHAQVMPNEIEKQPLSQAQQTTQIENPDAFVKTLWASAEQAAKELGLPTEALLAQAALETGWGQHLMQTIDGGASHNLFGIKADRNWEGGQVRKETLEYQQDVAVLKRENFRSYDSFEESFSDYVAFLKQNPRYESALNQAQDSKAYFKALQDAGYATDPNYADKILRVMQGSEMQAAIQKFKGSPQQPI
ncbi:MAG: flagellar assembly peptidoglycan hydrolase FlgJ [Candidatus Thiodiazotropha sp.]|jgi:peptidoglycan hydrolase FlgJ